MSYVGTKPGWRPNLELAVLPEGQGRKTVLEQVTAARAAWATDPENPDVDPATVDTRPLTEDELEAASAFDHDDEDEDLDL